MKTYFSVRNAIVLECIEEVRGSPSAFTEDCIIPHSHAFTVLTLGVDVFETREEALAYINETMIPDQIRDLEEKIAKLKGMVFE